MATKEQLKALRKKYGLGEFKKQKAKIFKPRTAKFSMAKRRTSRKSRRSRGFASSGMTSQIVPILLAYGYETYVSPKIPIGTQMTKNVAELAGSYYLARKGGLLGSTAKVVFIVEAFNLISQVAGSSGASASSSSAYY